MSLWSGKYVMNKSIMIFHWILNLIEILLVGRVPELTCQSDPKEKTSVKFQNNTYIFFEQNAFENVVCKVLAIPFRPQYVKI